MRVDVRVETAGCVGPGAALRTANGTVCHCSRVRRRSFCYFFRRCCVGAKKRLCFGGLPPAGMGGQQKDLDYRPPTKLVVLSLVIAVGNVLDIVIHLLSSDAAFWVRLIGCAMLIQVGVAVVGPRGWLSALGPPHTPHPNLWCL